MSRLHFVERFSPNLVQVLVLILELFLLILRHIMRNLLPWGCPDLIKAILWNGLQLFKLNVFIEQEAVSEPCAFSNLRLNKDVTIELVNDLLADKKAKSNALGVHLLSALKVTKHFEQLLLIFVGDACSRVKHCDNNLVLSLRCKCFSISLFVLVHPLFLSIRLLIRLWLFC